MRQFFTRLNESLLISGQTLLNEWLTIDIIYILLVQDAHNLNNEQAFMKANAPTNVLNVTNRNK